MEITIKLFICHKNMRNKIFTKVEDIDKIAKEIGRIKNVRAVYLFGSYATGKNFPFSDIDLCIIGNLSQKEKYAALSSLSDNLDISFFEDLPIYIKIRVFREGKPLYIKDKDFINFVKVKTIKKYLDFRKIINRYTKEVFHG